MEHTTFTLIPERSREPLARYDVDPYAWAMQQFELLKAGRFDDLDLVNLADEIADVGRREYDKLETDLARVVQHLLRWDYQPTHRGRSWANSIKEHRRRVVRQLDENRSLKRRLDEALQEAFVRGRAEASIETDLPDDAFPSSNPYSWDDAMGRPIAWPKP